MKKYKLIKRYPGNSALGLIASCRESGGYRDALGGIHSKAEIENYPEFWKEVVDLDFEVLSTKGDGTLDIYSIKRLSDGEIFSISDKIGHKKTGSVGKIISIHKSNNGRTIYFSTEYCHSTEGTILSNAIKIKEPLFITKDGIDLYQGDRYFQINDMFESSECIAYDKNNFDKKLIIFSIKETAQQYIDNNKPMYSKSQIKKAMSDSSCNGFVGEAIQTKYFKQQLNLN